MYKSYVRRPQISHGLGGVTVTGGTTIGGGGTMPAMSLFVIVHVLLSPVARVIFPPESQSPLKLEVYPTNESSLTANVPGARVYEVPGASTPGAGLPLTSVSPNDPALFTCKLKEEATALPPLSFI